MWRWRQRDQPFGQLRAGLGHIKAEMGEQGFFERGGEAKLEELPDLGLLWVGRVGELLVAEGLEVSGLGGLVEEMCFVGQLGVGLDAADQEPAGGAGVGGGGVMTEAAAKSEAGEDGGAGGARGGGAEREGGGGGGAKREGAAEEERSP